MLREYLDALLVAGLAALFFITFVIRTFYIPSVSMVPTLQVRDVLLVDEIAYRLHAPQRGDVAVFTPPVPSNGDEFVKRVIGTPGDTIRVADGIVFRNGVALREPYENQPPRYDLEIKDYDIFVDGAPLDSRRADIPPRALWQAPDRIPNGFFFMLGDNRNYSDDSHVWGFAQLSGTFASGPLVASRTRAAFAGRAFAIVWPLSRLHVLRDPS
ncbi:MAG: signal peptidase I [Candidatus Eremiobacteraeota bacterium]|nr:signal peptidase I [Candidatus Eremiobacteraeota bacterium]